MKEIKLENSHLVAVIDDEDFELVRPHRWYLRVRKGLNYAEAHVYGKRACGMHRVILGIVSNIHIDHIDNDGLNNRKSNLRFATASQNQANTHLRVDNTSGFKGVSWDKSLNRWRVSIRKRGSKRYVGVFTDPIAAAHAYDEAALEYFGEFARINFPRKGEETMPSGTRFIATVKDTRFNLSVKQYDFLKKKTFKVPENWREAASAQSLITRKLFIRRNGSLVRTKLGDVLLSALTTRIKKAVKESAK